MLVSIITPVLNRKKYVEECIQNILKQTYPNIEHIFVDGGSTDGTLEVLQKYAFEPRVRYISEKDNGIGDAVNKGWRMAKGDILGWIDVGDYYEVNAIESVVRAFQSYLDDVGVVFGGGRMVNDKGELLRDYITKDFDWKETRDNVNQMHTPPSAFYRYYVIKTWYQLGNKLPNSGDSFELHLWTGLNYHIHRIDRQIFNVRLQKESVTYQNRKLVDESFRTCCQICRKWGGSLLAPRCRRYFLYRILMALNIYDFVVLKLLVNIRRFSIANKLLSKLGMVTN